MTERVYGFDALPELGVVDRPECVCRHPFAWSGIVADGGPYALYRVESALERRLDYTLTLYAGTPAHDDDWQRDATEFHVAFRVDEATGPGFMMLDGVEVSATGERQRFERDDALAHARVQEAWDLIDWLCTTDPMFHQVYHHGVWPTELNWPMVAEPCPPEKPKRSFWDRLMDR